MLSQQDLEDVRNAIGFFIEKYPTRGATLAKKALHRIDRACVEALKKNDSVADKIEEPEDYV